MYLDPADENITKLIERGLSGPVVMLNLLRFREEADYRAHPKLAPAAPISGRQAYQRYMEHTMPYLTESGGSVDFVGEGGHAFIGPIEERWDLVLLVRQSNIESFFDFASNEGYLAGLGHREAALVDSRLIPLVEGSAST